MAWRLPMTGAMLLIHVLAGREVVTPGDLWSHWRAEPVAVVLVLLSGALYARGTHVLRRRGVVQAVSPRRVGAFAGALVALWIAVASPLDAVADSLFTGHMVQHLVLTSIAAPLWAYAAPVVPMMWGVPRGVRLGSGRAWRGTGARVMAVLGAPAVAWGAHTAALWVWHLPGPYMAALRDPVVHALEHASFFGTALLVWWVILRPFRHSRDAGGAAVAVAFGTMMQGSLLGALLTFSRTPWYPSQSVAAAAWGLSPIDDQQLAGLVTWIPAGLIYLGVVLALAHRWLRESPPLAATLH